MFINYTGESHQFWLLIRVFSHQSKTTTRQRQDNKTNVEPVHSYDAFHTRHVGPGVKGIIGMHRFNICLVVVLSLSCSGVKTPLLVLQKKKCRLSYSSTYSNNIIIVLIIYLKRTI